MSFVVSAVQTGMMCGVFWTAGERAKGDEVEQHLDYEVEGIHEILRQCLELDIRMSGVYIDGKLEAFTIGSYNPTENMAVIHIEKANPGNSRIVSVY